MKTTLQKIDSIILLAIALVLFILIVVDFPWKTVGLNLAMILGYIICAVAGIISFLAASNNLPNFLKEE